MPAAVFVVAGALGTRSGGSIYNRRMVESLRALGWTVDVVELGGAYPEPGPAAVAEAGAVFARLATGSTVVVDGLALAALADVVAAERQRLRLVALMHLPVAAAIGLEPARARRLAVLERRALDAVAAVIITGQAARELLPTYGVAAEKVHLVQPGTDPAPLARGSSEGSLQLLSVATIHAGKGHHLLVNALAPLADHDWTMICAGSLTHDPDTSASVLARVTELGLADRIRLVGEVDEERLDACYREADVFVLASLQETYGMAVAEALARGLPVVGTDTGAIGLLVGSDAGIVVPPGDGDALAGALGRIITDAALRGRLRAGARARRTTLPDWLEAAGCLTQVLDAESGHG